MIPISKMAVFAEFSCKAGIKKWSLANGQNVVNLLKVFFIENA